MIRPKVDCKSCINPVVNSELTYDSARIDGRVGWTVFERQEIAIGYASKAEITFWAQVELGDTTRRRETVAELNRNGIKTNFILVNPQSTVPNV